MLRQRSEESCYLPQALRAVLGLEDASEARIYHSLFSSDSVTIDDDDSATCLIAHSGIEGSVTADCQCLSSNDSSFQLLDDACQPPAP